MTPDRELHLRFSDDINMRLTFYSESQALRWSSRHGMCGIDLVVVRVALALLIAYKSIQNITFKVNSWVKLLQNVFEV